MVKITLFVVVGTNAGNLEDYGNVAVKSLVELW